MNSFSEWIESRNRNWSNPAGFLSVTSINWLSETPQTFKDVSGSWWAIDHDVYSDGFEGAGEQHWTVKERDEFTVPMTGGVLEIASRGGQIVLRPRHTDSPALKAFKGVSVFEYDPAYALVAELVEDDRNVGVSSSAGDLGISYDSPGKLVFELHGERVELTAFTRPDPTQLWVIFRDGSSGKTTYGTGRNVTAKKREDGKWDIDFNLSGNFPCSYTDFATCPMAPRENHLAVAIEAGEKTPEFRHTLEGVVPQGY
jgi:uncharacterized protein (DUF1684 family)